jgi:putative PIN family toxin of toxin-antitoxin system
MWTSSRATDTSTRKRPLAQRGIARANRDTNVLVSGLLNPFGPPGRIVEMLIAGRLQALHDSRIIAEYREVLSRAELDLDPQDVGTVLEAIELGGEGILASDPLRAALPDPDDLPFLEVATAGRADALVTGSVRYFPPRERRGTTVLTPREMLERMQAEE